MPEKSEDQRSIYIMVDPNLYARIKYNAALRGVSMKEYVTKILESHLMEQPDNK